MGVFDDMPVAEQFEIVANYILNIWLQSDTFYDDIEEPRCLLVLQSIARKLGISFKEWLELTDRAKPEWFKEDIKLGKILKDVDINL